MKELELKDNELCTFDIVIKTESWITEETWKEWENISTDFNWKVTCGAKKHTHPQEERKEQ